MGVTSSLIQFECEWEDGHGIDIPRNEITHHEERTEETYIISIPFYFQSEKYWKLTSYSDEERRIVKVDGIEERRLPHSVIPSL